MADITNDSINPVSGTSTTANSSGASGTPAPGFATSLNTNAQIGSTLGDVMKNSPKVIEAMEQAVMNSIITSCANFQNEMRRIRQESEGRS